LQGAPRGRSNLLLSTFALTAFALSACGGAPEPSVQVQVKAAKTSLNPLLKICDQYAGSAQLYSFCIYEQARHLPNVGGVEISCKLAGEWEADCRHAWVLQQFELKELNPDVLLRACGSNQECIFDVLDAVKSDQPLKEMDRCAALTENLAFHCREHALELWRVTSPVAMDVQALLAKQTEPDPQIIRFISSVVACSNVGTCSGTDSVKRACERSVARYRSGEISCQLNGGIESP
jgi:hypothetical protein